jgi:hypothetical protein
MTDRLKKELCVEKLSYGKLGVFFQNWNVMNVKWKRDFTSWNTAEEIFKKNFFNILSTKFVIDGYIGRVNESLNSAQWAYDILTECTVNFRKGIS